MRGLWTQPGWWWQVGIWLFPFAKLTLHSEHKLRLLCWLIIQTLCRDPDIVSIKQTWYKALLCCRNAKVQCSVQDFHGQGFDTDHNQCLQKVTCHMSQAFRLTSSTTLQLATALSAKRELVLTATAGPGKRWTNLGVLYLLELVLQASTTACLTIPCHRPVTTTDLGIIDALLDQCTHLFLSGPCSTHDTCCQVVDAKAVSLTY